MGYTEEPSSSCAVCHKEASMQCVMCLRNGVDKDTMFCGEECFRGHFNQHRPGGKKPVTQHAPTAPYTPSRPRASASPLPSPHQARQYSTPQGLRCSVEYQGHSYQRPGSYRNGMQQRQLEVGTKN